MLIMRDDRRRPELRPLDQTIPITFSTTLLPPLDNTTQRPPSPNLTNSITPGSSQGSPSRGTDGTPTPRNSKSASSSPNHPFTSPRREDTHILTHFNRVPAPPREEDTVARLHSSGHHLALLVRRAGPYSDHRRLWQRRARRRRGQEDARRGFLQFKLLGMSFLRTGRKRGRKRRRTVSGLKRWTRTRSRRGTTALMDLNVAWTDCTQQNTVVSSFLHPSLTFALHPHHLKDNFS